MVHGLAASAAVPRGLLVADAWSQLGDAVAPLSNASGRPLARTVKLLLDPLVLRPAQNPRFSGGVVAIEHVDALRRAILDAGPALAATAAWFQLVKRARRRAGITEGHPQDLYFQRCFELAHLHGDPGALPDAAAIAAATVADVHAERGEVSVEGLRRFLTDPERTAELAGLLREAWADRPEAPAAGPDPGLAAFLADCAAAPDPRLWKALADTAVGTAEAAELDRVGVAAGYGLTARDRPAAPELGDRASKRDLPRPFDRSIMERLFAAFTTWFQREAMADIPSLVTGEIRRSAAPWQLAEEPSRVAMALGRDASAGLGADAAEPASDANARLLSRWRRESYVHRVMRLPREDGDEVRGTRRAYLRRLWARLHGRELRGEPTAADEVWDLLDGSLRSVVMDQRDRLRRRLERAGAPE
ncbi:hypothetical protein [Glycomyces terrestris]|uniref:Uncharacterized protein n=1 Tax=Glycomyces terrestris TaxID=2493553 RepID=A0A426URM5_9ACTN|nr:hypothetical protein [Glycomyces terrestris]RRR95819.1 hypothetical protein EIW28_23300 [Glycomyces terrestris]